MIVLLLKVTLLASLALTSEQLLSRRGAALRHLLYATAILAVLLMTLTMALGTRATPIPVPGTVRIVVDAVQSPALLSTSIGTALSRWIPILWLAGALVFLFRLALGHTLARLAVRRGVRVSTVMEGMTVTVIEADVPGPVVTGLLRPAILIPRSAKEWPETFLFAAYRHELAHVERLDLWTTLAGQLACAVYWFHPMGWARARRMRTLQELACDDAVLSSGFAPVAYAEALVAVAGQFTSSHMQGCHMLTEKTLKSRIARLVDGSLRRVDSTTTVRRATLVFAAVAACIGLANAGPQQPADQAAADKAYADGAFKVGNGITPPKLLHKIDPKYTEDARTAKISGAVLLRVVVGTDGKAHDINVVSTIDPGLSQKAVEAVQQWDFQPGQKDGQPVNVFAQIEVNFRLE